MGTSGIVGRTAELAHELGLPTVVITFDPHPDEVVRPGTHPPLLCTPKRRAALLAGLGADAVMVLPFTLELSQMGPDEFVQSVLVDRLHAARVVVGEDFRFGHRAKGDVALLRGARRQVRLRGRGRAARGRRRADLLDAVRERLAGGDVEGAARGCWAVRTGSRAWSYAARSAAVTSASRRPTSKAAAHRHPARRRVRAAS